MGMEVTDGIKPINLKAVAYFGDTHTISAWCTDLSGTNMSATDISTVTSEPTNIPTLKTTLTLS